MSEEEQGMVLLNRKDVALGKIKEFREKNILQVKTAIKDKKIYEAQGRFLYLFLKLIDTMSITSEQIKTLTEEELKEVADYVDRKAKPWAISQFLYFCFVPFIGWFGCFSSNRGVAFPSFWYRYYRKKIMKAFKDDYFPYHRLKKGEVWKPYTSGEVW